MKIRYFLLFFTFSFFVVSAQNIQNNPESNHGNKFEQLGTILPTPNNYRTASGAVSYTHLDVYKRQFLYRLRKI